MTAEIIESARPETEHTLTPRAERLLLSISAVFMLVSVLSLSLTRAQFQPLDWVSLLVWVGCAIAGHLLLQRYLPERDPLIFPLAMFLSGWGLVLIDRLAPNFADRQTVWLIVSLGGMLAAALIPDVLRWLRAFRYLLLVGGLALLVSTILLGRNPSGLPGAPELWLGFGNIFYQPSEALKIILVAFLASYLGEQYPAMRAAGLDGGRRGLWLSPRIAGPILLMWGLCMGILVWQRDLGTAILFFLVFMVLIYVASGYTLVLVSGILLTILAGAAAYALFAYIERETGMFVNPFVRRVDIWLDPWSDADGRAFQVVQSLLAFAAGGVFGQGVGQGAPTFIPVVHSDFVFAAIAEEWGLLGVLATIICIALLVMRGLRTAVMQRSRPFNTLLAVGLSALIAVQTLMIMGGVLKLIPLTGVTLPYLSYGGSSLLTNFIIVGLLLRLSAGEA